MRWPWLDSRFIDELPRRLIGDRAYDADPLDEALLELGVEMIAPHRRNRTSPKTQDGRPLRRYRRRWKVEIAHPQMTKPNGWTVAGGGNNIADLDITIRDNDAVNEEFDQLAALSKGCVGKTLLDLFTKLPNGRHDLRDGLMLIHLRLQLLLLPLQSLQMFVQRLPTVAIVRQRHGPGLIGIAHALDLASQMLQPTLQLGTPRSAVPGVTTLPPALAPAPAQYSQDASAPRTDPARPGRPAGEPGYSVPDTDLLDARGGQALCQHRYSTHSAAALLVPYTHSRRPRN
jgi:hypothetical protein